MRLPGLAMGVPVPVTDQQADPQAALARLPQPQFVRVVQHVLHDGEPFTGEVIGCEAGGHRVTSCSPATVSRNTAPTSMVSGGSARPTTRAWMVAAIAALARSTCSAGRPAARSRAVQVLV